MTVEDVMTRLEGLGSEKQRAMNAKNGAGENQFGVKMGDLRIVAKETKIDHELGLKLWETGNVDARHLATLIMKPKQLSADQIDAMTRSVTYTNLADWFTSYVTKNHPEKESLRQKWMVDPDPMAARAGWSLTYERITKDPAGLDLGALLDRIESEMANAPAPTQWTMNFCLGGIGIEFPEHRERAIAIGEKLGVYRDYPCSKGCTSPFVPIWIKTMVDRDS